MSLTSFLERKDVKAQFRETFAKPAVAPYQALRGIPLTKNYSLVGTAFDYVVRFYLERLYPFAHASPWVAEIALSSPATLFILPQAEGIIQTARQHHQTYLETGLLTDELLRSALLLAQIDPWFRARKIVPDFGTVDKRDITDLRNLIGLVTPQTFQAEHVCLLDPTFGAASKLVGGADVDLVIDDAIIDIKTTINSKFQRDHFDQLIGYYILYQLGGIDGLRPGHEINKVGIYSSRYGGLYDFAITDLAAEGVFETFSKWFVEQAQQVFGTNLEELKANG